MIPSNIVVRGTQVAYYEICKTKLWLFSHFISLEHSSELVKEGLLIHETHYTKENKEININHEISLDIIRTNKGIEIREIKKSPKMEKAHVLQMKYYMYYLNKKGIKIKRGTILYPSHRKIKEVEFRESDIKLMKEVIENIKEIIFTDKPPIPHYKPYCKKCAYYEFCFG